MTNDNGIMDIDGLCDYLKTSRSTTYKLAQKALLPSHKVGRQWRFNRDEIDKWLRTQSGASALATFREAEPVQKAKTPATGDSWDKTLSNAGFEDEQIERLRAFMFDSPIKLMAAMATKAGRAGLCDALKLGEDELNARATKLAAILNEGR